MSARVLPAFILITLLFFAVRLYNLTIIPIENDEASYIYVAHLVRENFALYWDESFAHWVMSVPPLFVWWVSFWLDRVQDPLVAGRVASVSAGLLTLIGVFWMARTIYSLPVAVIASVLLIFSPLHLDSDRKAVTDSLMGGWFVMLLAMLTRIGRNPAWLWSILAGICLGLSAWAKQTGMLGFAALPLTFLYIPWKQLQIWKPKVETSQLLGLVILLATTAGIAYFIIALQGISPKLATLQSRTAGIVTGVGGQSLLDNPFANAVVNIPNTLEIFWKYYLVPGIVVFIAGMVLAIRERHEPTLALGISFIYLAAPIILLGLPYGSKYLYYVTIPFLIALAYFVYQIPVWVRKQVALFSPNVFRIGLGSAVLLPMVLVVNMITKDPIDPHMYHVDNRYYFDGSGYGIPELVQKVKELKAKHPDRRLTILAEGISGHLWHTLSVYFFRDDQVSVRPFERSLNFLKSPEEITQYLETIPTQAASLVDKRDLLLMATNNNQPTALPAERFTRLLSVPKPLPPKSNFLRDLQIIEYDQYRGFHVDLYEVKR